MFGACRMPEGTVQLTAEVDDIVLRGRAFEIGQFFAGGGHKARRPENKDKSEDPKKAEEAEPAMV